jgi:hypothetical protein
MESPAAPPKELLAAPRRRISPQQSPPIGFAERRRMGIAGSRSGVSVQKRSPSRKRLRDGSPPQELRERGATPPPPPSRVVGVEAGPRTSRSGYRHGCVSGSPLGCVPPPWWFSTAGPRERPPRKACLPVDSPRSGHSTRPRGGGTRSREMGPDPRGPASGGPVRGDDWRKPTEARSRVTRGGEPGGPVRGAHWGCGSAPSRVPRRRR